MLPHVCWGGGKGNEAFCFLLPTVFFCPGSLFISNYNLDAVYLLLLASALLCAARRRELDRKCRACYFAAGIVLGVCCTVYPTVVVIALVLAVWILWDNRRKNSAAKAFWYCLGGGLTAVVYFAWIFSHGSLRLFSKALHGMTHFSTYPLSQITNPELYYNIFFKNMRQYIGKYLLKTDSTGLIITVFILILAVLAMLLLFVRKHFPKSLQTQGLLFIAFILLSSVVWPQHAGGTGGAMALSVLLASCALLWGNKQSKVLARYGIVLAVLCMFILIYIFTSDNMSITASFGVAGPMIFAWAGLVVWNLFYKEHKRLTVCILAALCFMGTWRAYTYVYRDEPVTQLTQRVETGIYKGLYTTEERKTYVEELQQVLQEHVLPSDTLCSVTMAPAVYVMTPARIYTPNTWSALHLSKGDTSAAPLTDYFAALGENPTVIVAQDDRNPDFYQNPKYEINAFIEENYSLICEEKAGETTVYLWRLKEAENG